MKSTNKVLCLGCLSLWVAGCASNSQVAGDSQTPPAGSVSSAAASQTSIPKDDKLARIKCGVTTEAELLDWFGPANSRETDPAGGQKLTWKSDNLVALLDAKGKVIGVLVMPVVIH